MGLLLYSGSRAILRCAFFLGGGMTVSGKENVPAEGPLIVASNHASHLDPMILGAAFDRPLHFMARKTLFDTPVFSWFIRQTFAFPLDREGDSRDALRAFGVRLEGGNAVVMFPEGTRTPDGALQEMKPGIGMLAVRNLAPVVPVYVWGSYFAWPRGKSFPRPHALRVYIGEAIIPDPDKSVRKTEQVRLTEAVGAALAAMERRGREETAITKTTTASGWRT
jgi:1-acyl-sn-glycerol-3-phosphate acyltransferase